MGIAARVAPAMRMPTSMEVSAWKVAIPREMVKLLPLPSIISWRK